MHIWKLKIKTKVKKIFRGQVIKEITEHLKFHQKVSGIGEESSFPSWERVPRGEGLGDLEADRLSQDVTAGCF